MQERLEQDLKTAMRRGDILRRTVIRYLRSAIHYEEIAKGGPLDDNGVISVINRQVRQRHESIEAFRKGNRLDLSQQEESELSVLMEYLPQQMSRNEIAALARQAIKETGASGPSEKGKVMGRLMPQLRGKADGATVNIVVTELLEEQVKT